MKTFLKIILSLFLGIIAFTALLIFIYVRNVRHTMQEKETLITRKWNEFNQKRIEQRVVIGKIIKHSDSSYQYLLKANLNGDNYSLAFCKQEHDLNEAVLKYLNKHQDEEQKSITDEWLKINTLINEDIDVYNAEVIMYNRFIGTFPNFFVAKKYQFKSKPYFALIYGSHNEDPVEKDRKLQEWIQTGKEM